MIQSFAAGLFSTYKNANKEYLDMLKSLRNTLKTDRLQLNAMYTRQLKRVELLKIL